VSCLSCFFDCCIYLAPDVGSQGAVEAEGQHLLRMRRAFSSGKLMSGFAAADMSAAAAAGVSGDLHSHG
jgi:hypothetical protein